MLFKTGCVMIQGVTYILLYRIGIKYNFYTNNRLCYIIGKYSKCDI